MSWIQTYTGKQFYPLEPNLDDISIADIAHALAMTCRYNGHCRRFYSVAEHSVLLSHTVDEEHAQWGLLHDAAEAYIGDMVRPLKHVLPEFVGFEESTDAVIAAKFGLPWPMPEQVREHDTRIIVDEWSQNMAPNNQPWSVSDGVKPLGVNIQCWAPAQAEAEFLFRYQQLFT